MAIQSEVERRIVARNILVKHTGLDRTTASVIASRWEDDAVLRVLSATAGEVNSVLAGITPQELVPQAVREEFASLRNVGSAPPKVEPPAVSETTTEASAIPADDM